MGDFWGRGLDFRPLGNEIGQGLGFYRRAWNELDVIAHELDCPFRNPSHGVAVADNFSEWKRGDDRHLMLGEVVLEFLGCHDAAYRSFCV